MAPLNEQDVKDDDESLAYEQTRLKFAVVDLLEGTRQQTKTGKTELTQRTGISQPVISNFTNGNISLGIGMSHVVKLLYAMGYRLTVAIEPLDDSPIVRTVERMQPKRHS